MKETTIESTQKAAQARLIQEAAEKKRLEEEERLREEKRQANGKIKDTILSAFCVQDLWFIAHTVRMSGIPCFSICLKIYLGGESSDESGSDLEDEFMPKKTPVITGPNLSNRTVTSNAKTARHNSVMWSHMCGKNIDQAKPVEIIKYEVCFLHIFIFKLLNFSGHKSGRFRNDRKTRRTWIRTTL